MAILRYRSITITLSAVAIIYNTLSAYLFHHFPDDPYHLALSFCAYSHFASLLSILGLIGALREHASLVTIFANYLIIDTVLCFIPRFLTATLVAGLREHLCSNPNLSSIFQQATQFSPSTISSTNVTPYDLSNSGKWSESSCHHFVAILQTLVLVGAVATTLAHFFLALQVREYGNKLMTREQEWSDEANAAAVAAVAAKDLEEERMLFANEKRGLLIHYSDDDDKNHKDREDGRSSWDWNSPQLRSEGGEKMR